jgi:hypothetical protein
MKPPLSIALLALGLTFPPSAVASSIHLTCTEATATGRPPTVRLLFIDAEAGKASLGGRWRTLYVKPNQYRLIKVVYEPFLVSTFNINRTTLKFTSKTSTDNTKQESTGQCRITPIAPGAQI